MATVAVGDSVILYVNSEKYLFAEVDPKKRINVGKANISATELEGKQYGASFSVDRNKLVPLQANELLSFLKDEIDSETVPDANNSKLVDDNTSQKLSQADIVALKEKGTSGKDVIKALVGNSSTFHTKTDFSKEKYLKKKSKKHITTVQILKGTANSILTAYYTKNPAKKVMVVESCQGLIIGSIAERMGGLEMSKPSTPAVKSFNFPKQVEDTIITFAVSLLTNEQQPQQEQQQQQQQQQPEQPQQPQQQDNKPEASTTETEAKTQMEAQREANREATESMIKEGADSLIVVTKYAPQTLMPRLVRALKGGAAFAVFSVHPQPLAETHEILRSLGLAVNMGLAETWLRVHQVLPGRTHPNMSMDGASGYILHGIRVIPTAQEEKKEVVAEKGDSSRGTKRKSEEEAAGESQQKQSKQDEVK